MDDSALYDAVGALLNAVADTAKELAAVRPLDIASVRQCLAALKDMQGIIDNGGVKKEFVVKFADQELEEYAK